MTDRYRDRLARHPGVLWAAFFTAMFFLAAVSGERGTAGLVAASVASALVWGTVFWTARCR